jgi:ADP-ribose pyrophosphatase YjhB (NUDIX family)
MLFELPTADEIDSLAITAPKFEVRRFELDMGSNKADLNYTPCKGQMVVVILGEKGVALAKDEASGGWRLPSGRIAILEDAEAAAKRVAREDCGLTVTSLELAGIYDVVWHYSDISIKRLHLVYAGVTEDDCWTEARPCKGREAKFFREVPEGALRNEVERAALADCSEK